jgi:hypothetical protein
MAVMLIRRMDSIVMPRFLSRGPRPGKIGRHFISSTDLAVW